MFKHLSLFAKILIMGSAFIVVSSIFLGWSYFQIKDTAYSSNMLKTRKVVETAWSTANAYAKKARAGELPEEEARKKALDTLKMLRYDKDNYFWVNDMAPRMIMHPVKPELDGKDMSDYADPRGKKLFVEFAKVCREKGEGFVDYEWSRPGQTKPVPKLSYVKVVPEWGWIIGSGMYLDDVAQETANINKVAGIALGAVGLLVVGGLLLSWSMARAISTPVTKAALALSEEANRVSSASGQLSHASQSLADGSSDQAASLKETASAMEEMSAMIMRNTESAGQARTLSEQSGAAIGNANASMNLLVGQMAEISSMGEEIGKIIKTIDEIAFQTNLLALNAAVEAARAGEAGAGFAVVADEVRNLSQRAAGAASSTGDLIESTIRKIQYGTGLVEKTNAAFSEVTASVKKVAGLVAEVSTASSEQARGIGEISHAVSRMDKVTQGNVAFAGELASASEEMSTQAHSLQEVVRMLDEVVKGAGRPSLAGAAGARASAIPGGIRPYILQTRSN